MENGITIVLPSVEEKELFMEWFKRRGFNQFLEYAEKESSISCIASFEVGTTGEELSATIENGYIELE